MSDGRPRITGGALRGRALAVPPGDTVRPMRSRVRQSLFNILGDRVRGARVLDVFAGSGAIACEALSRGAREAVAIETSPLVLITLRHNIKELALGVQLTVLETNAYEYRPEEPFDGIFLDPPFPDYESEERSPWALLASLAQSGLAEGGWIGMEMPRGEEVREIEGLELMTSRSYGDTALALWEKNTP